MGIRRGKDICYNSTVPPTKHRTTTRQRLVQLHVGDVTNVVKVRSVHDTWLGGLGLRGFGV